MTRRTRAEQLALYPGRTAGLDVFVTHTTGYLRDVQVGTADTIDDCALLATRRLGLQVVAQVDGDEWLLVHFARIDSPSAAVGMVAPAGRYSGVEGGS